MDRRGHWALRPSRMTNRRSGPSARAPEPLHGLSVYRSALWETACCSPRGRLGYGEFGLSGPRLPVFPIPGAMPNRITRISGRIGRIPAMTIKLDKALERDLPSRGASFGAEL